MPWKVSSPVSQRAEFLALATAEGANIRHLCRRFGISHTTAYTLLARARADPEAAPLARSRRPHTSPARCEPAVEQAVLALRDEHPAWGGRKLRRRLQDLGHARVPAASTVTEILRRNDRLRPEDSAQRVPFTRFEHAHPNDLWQMDFKGEVVISGGWCFPLTVLDDHSRFALAIEACPGVLTETTQTALTRAFRRYGLPRRMTMDNGKPWAATYNGRSCVTGFAVWLMRLGVAVSHSRPYHPQTQGKDERLHRSLKREVLGGRTWTDLAQCQVAFDRWRAVYNLERPHEALGLAVPATRYSPSPRAFPERLPEIEYANEDQVRKVQSRGQMKFAGQRFWIGKAFIGLPVGVRPTTHDGRYDVYFCQQRVRQIDLHGSSSE